MLVFLEEWVLRYSISQRVRSLRPTLETLEDRWCPSVTASVTGGHILTLTGDNAANDIRINDSGAGQLDVRINGGSTVTYSGVNTLDINAGNGNDGIFYSVRGNLVKDRAINVNLGDGNSRFDFRTVAGASILGGGADPLRLDVNVHGGKGNDWISGNLGDVFNAQVTVRAYLGSGNNTFNYYLSGDITDGTPAQNVGTDAVTTKHTEVNVLAIGGTGTNSLGVTAENVSVGVRALLETDLPPTASTICCPPSIRAGSMAL